MAHSRRRLQGRVARRLRTIPVVLVGTPVALLLSPLLALIAIAGDVAEGCARWRWLRLLGLTLAYAVLETVAIVTGFGLWIATGFGALNRTEWSQRRHHRIQVWWATRVIRAIERFMATEIVVEGDEVVTPGPVIAVARHTSFGDSLVPALVLGARHDLRLRYVLKKELQLVPALDIYGHRLPNHFVDRTPAARDGELDPIRQLAAGMDDHDAAVIFPEGTFRTPTRYERSLARLERKEPGRLDSARRVRHLLPTRPGGTLALLEGAPTADVVVIAHRGFERFASFKSIIANVPFDGPVDVSVWRVPRSSIPDDPGDQVDWLDREWERVDDWISRGIAARGGS